MDLGPVDGRLLEDDCLRRQALGERGEHVARRERLAGLRRSGGGGERNCCGGAASRCGSRPARARGCRGGWRENRQLDRAAVRFGGVFGDNCHARALGGEAARVARRLAERARSDDQDDVVGRQSLAQAGRSAGNTPANRRMVLREAGAGAEGFLEHRCDKPLRQLDERLPASRACRRRRPRRARATSASRGSARKLRHRRLVRGVRAHHPPGGSVLDARGRLPAASRPSARSRAQARVRWPPRGTRGRSPPAHPAAGRARRPRPGSRRRGRAGVLPGRARRRGAAGPAGRR